MFVAQADPTAGGPLAYAGTFVLATLFYGATLHVAARYVLGDVRVTRAFAVAPVLGLVAIVVDLIGPAATLVATVVVAYAAVHVVYDLGHRTTAFVLVVYYTVAVLVGVLAVGLASLFGAAPA